MSEVEKLRKDTIEKVKKLILCGSVTEAKLIADEIKYKPLALIDEKSKERMNLIKQYKKLVKCGD